MAEEVDSDGRKGAAEATPVDLPEPATAPDPAPEPEPAAEAPPARRRGGGLGLVALAGVALAGGLGFAAAWFDPMKWRGDDPVPALQAQVADLSARLDQGGADLAALAARLDAAEAAPAAAGAEALAALEGRVAALEGTLEALSKAPALADGSVPAASFAALSQAVDSLQAELAAIKAAPVPGSAAEIAAAVDKAMADWAAGQEAAAKAAVEAARVKAAQVEAVEALRAAARSGAPYAEPLQALAALAPDPVLAAHAESGMTTVNDLAEAFPEAARAALDASLRAGGDGGFLNFLRIQTGARSLSPRDGDDPDAVLSRAEAAVKAGEVQAALDELAALPPEGQAAMQDWMARAADHLAAAAAIAALAAKAGL